jgi:transposase
MQRYRKKKDEKRKIFVGIDVHKRTWQVSIIAENEELKNVSIPADRLVLKRLLSRHENCEIQAVYEAGYFGYGLYDYLKQLGVKCVVTPPSLVPGAYGNRVKTDKRDSRKLAILLSKGLLKKVYVPDEQARYDREVIRRYQQLTGDQRRVQARIKSQLELYGIELETTGNWSQRYLEGLKRIRLGNRYLQASFKALLEEYEVLSKMRKQQKALLSELSQEDRYREQMEKLQSVYGVGLICGMTFLLELQAIERFKNGKQLSAYVGLTPSQYSSGDKVRMGRITCIGKPQLRGQLVESAWMLIRKDGELRRKYEELKQRCGGKRAIVAVARKLLLRMRCLLLENRPYVMTTRTA